MKKLGERHCLTTEHFDDARAFVLFGQRYDIGVPVVRWDHDEGFDGYTQKRVVAKTENRKTGRVKTSIIKGNRFGKRSIWGKKSQLKKITQFFIHHSGGDGDGPGNIYNTLYMSRKLSVQFVIDEDRIFQFNDAGDNCWHGGKHNPISIGVECSHYPLASVKPDYYSEARNARLHNLPHDTMIDVIHGQKMNVFCFTEPMITVLARLVAGVWTALNEQRKSFGLPHLPFIPVFPRNTQDRIPHTVIPRALKHVGLIGHLQCSRNKIDPAGFPWDQFESAVRKEMQGIHKNIIVSVEGGTIWD